MQEDKNKHFAVISRSRVRNFFKSPTSLLGLGLLGVLIFIAIFGPFFAPHAPEAQDYTKKFLPPAWFDQGSGDHLLGTDVLGRDLFSRIVFGTRLSLLIGLFAIVVGGFIGIPLGLISGFLGGKVDLLLMRLMDLMLALPSLLLAVVIVSILGPDLWNGVIAIGLVNIPSFARIARSGVLTELEKEYVAADRVIGRSSTKILLFGIVPNMIGPLIVVVTLSFGSAVLDAAGLSFLGLGAQPPSPEWGALIAEGRNYLFHAPWLIWFPGLAILVTVIVFNLLGDGLRDLMAPDEDPQGM